MTARYPAMIAIIRNSIKTGQRSCTVPVNSLCIIVLELLRNHGYIQGFSYQYTRRNLRQGPYHGYPQVKIILKYTDHNTPILKDIQSFKNTRSNYYTLKDRFKSTLFMSNQSAYILSSPNGVKLTFFTNTKDFQTESSSNLLTGKIIAKLSI